MRRRLAVSLALTALPVTAMADKTSPSTKLDDKTALLAPVTHDNLTIFPVITTSEKIPTTDYLVLDEGMKAKQVQIVETGDAETVYTHAQDDYTKALLAAVPIPDPHKMRARREERNKLKDVLAEPV